MPIELIPTPQSVTLKRGDLDARSLRLPALPKACPFDRQAMSELWSDAAGYPDGEGGTIRFQKVARLADEQYVLDVSPRGVRISHSTPRGAFYGFVTLTELMKLNPDGLSCCTIRDRPAMPIRAVTDDISRGQISTLANFKSIIRRLAQFKVNLYMPYIEDVLASAVEPELGKFSDPVPPAEWRQIIDYARKFFVEVRPVFNTLGHWDRMGPLARFADLMLPIPEKTCSPMVQVLDPSNPKVRPMLAKLLGELVDVFGPGLVHAGGDEPVHLTELYGVQKSAELYIDHYRWVHDELAKLGCTMAMYSDVFTPIWGHYAVGVKEAARMQRDIQMVYWCYAPDHDDSAMVELMDAGFTTFISPSTHLCGRINCDPLWSYKNAAHLAEVAAGRSAGMMMSAWGDTMDCPRELNWPGYAVGAEFGWSARPADYAALMRTYHRQFFGLDRSFDFSRFEPVYRIDPFIGLDAHHQSRRGPLASFWRDARRPVDEEFKKHAPAALAAIQAAREYMAACRPRFNAETYACLELAARKATFFARRLLTLEPGRYRTREQAQAAVPAIRELGIEVRNLLAGARERWLASNRLSQWPFVEARYLDLADSFESLARYCRHNAHFRGPDKFLLAE